jgi:hypothetical protein
MNHIINLCLSSLWFDKSTGPEEIEIQEEEEEEKRRTRKWKVKRT